MSADRTAQVRAAREAFAHAIAHNVTLAEANMQIARARWGAVEARAAARRSIPRDVSPQDSAPALQWWQRD